MQAANPGESQTPIDDSVAVRDLKPQLRPAVVRRRNADDDVVLVGTGPRQYLTIQPGEEGVLDLLDGGNDVGAVLELARNLPLPVRPLAVMGLLRRLVMADLVQGIAPDAAASLGAIPAPRRVARLSFLGRLASARLPVPGLGVVFAAGRLVPAHAWRLIRLASLLLFGVALFAAAGAGRFVELLDPFGAHHLEVRVPLIYLGAAALLSVRNLLRAWFATSHGVVVPTAQLHVLFGVLHLDFDDRNRRAAARAQRLDLAWTGVAALALGTAAATLYWLFLDGGGLGFAHATAATGVYLLLVDAMPYGRGDIWHIVGIQTAVPDLRRRSAAFLIRRTLRNLLRQEPIGAVERIYLAVACGWLGHAVLSLFLLAEYLVPGALRAVLETVRHPVSGEGLASIEGVVALVGTLVMLLILVALAVALLGVACAGVWQLVRQPHSTPPTRSARVGDAAAAMLDELRRVPFLAALDDEALGAVVGGMRDERHAAGATIVQQGEPGDRFCFLRTGEAEVLFEEESGLVHRLAILQAGDFFGEIALLQEVGRTATVRALGEAEVLSLDRETFVTLVEGSSFGAEAVLNQVRNAAFLRTVPVFQTLDAEQMRSLLAGVTVQDYAVGEQVVRQGEPGQEMFVIRQGACEVTRELAGTQQHIGSLDAGDFFGEIALLRSIPRTATVAVTEAATLVRVPADVLDDMLLADYTIGVDLQQFAAARLKDLEAR